MSTPPAALHAVFSFLSFVVAAAAQANWELQGGPSSRRGVDLAFDPVRAETVMFGGNDGTLRDETWVWDGAVWQLRQPSVRPSPRENMAMTWDSVHQRVLLFGGFAGTATALLDLWAWDGSTWTLLMPSTPSLPQNPTYSLVHDPVRDRVVLIADSGGAISLSEWNGTSWTNVPQGQLGLSSTAFSAPVFDPAVGRTTVFASHASSSGLWRWNGAVWTSQPVANIVGQAATRLVHDSVANRLLLVVGAGQGGNTTLYRFNPLTANWTPLAGGGAAVSQFGACYDTSRSRLVVVGGTGVGTPADTSVFEWSAGPFQRRTSAPPAARYSPAVAYDATAGRTWLLGGRTPSFVGDLWALDANGWRLRLAEDPDGLPPAALQGRRIVYDEARQQLLAVAGGTVGFPFSRLGASGWQAIAGPTPSQRMNPGVVYDHARARVVMFGGQSLLGSLFADTWIYDGTAWSLLSPAHVPPGNARHGMAYDRRRDRVVMVGGDAYGMGAGDTWEFDGVDWHQRPGSLAVGSVFDPALAYDAQREVVVALAPGLVNGALQTLQWDGVTWLPVSSAAAPPTRSLPTLLPTFAGMVSFGGALPPNASQLLADRYLLRSSQLAAVETFGAPGVSLAGPLTFTVVGNGPWLGSRVDLEVAGLPAFALPGVWAGASRTDWNGAPLPADLGALGWPGAIVRVALEIFVPVLSLGNGRARTFVDLPADPVLVGLPLHLQAFTFEPLTGVLTASNGLSLTAGLR